MQLDKMFKLWKEMYLHQTQEKQFWNLKQLLAQQVPKVLGNGKALFEAAMARLFLMQQELNII